MNLKYYENSYLSRKYIHINYYLFAGGIQARWEVTKAVYPYMISICLVYFVTLCLYPGIASEVISCRFGSWMSIIMMTIFNGADLFGKHHECGKSHFFPFQCVCNLQKISINKHLQDTFLQEVTNHISYTLFLEIIYEIEREFNKSDKQF